MAARSARRFRPSLAALAAAAWLLAAGCGDPETGSGSGEGEQTGLRFAALPLVPEDQVAPLGSYRARDGVELPVRHYPAESDVTLLLLHGSGYHGRYLGPLATRLARAGAGSVSVVTGELDALADLRTAQRR